MLDWNVVATGLEPPAPQYRIQLINISDGSVVVDFADGTSSGDSHKFTLPLDIRRDSHGLILSPASVDGSTDVLFRDDELDDKFYLTYDSANEEMVFLPSVDPASFVGDAAIKIPIGKPAEPIRFSALPVMFEKAVSIKKRTSGVFEFKVDPGNTEHILKDETSGNVLGKISKDFIEISGTKHHTLTSTPTKSGNYRFGFSGDATNLPISTPLCQLPEANKMVIGLLRFVAATSGGIIGRRSCEFSWDGTDAPMTDTMNTLPVQIIAEITHATEGPILSISYAGGLGVAINFSGSIEFSAAGRN